MGILVQDLPHIPAEFPFMDQPQVIELQLPDFRVPARIQRSYQVRSQHTGNSLVEIQAITSTTDAGIHERLTRTLKTLGDQVVRSTGSPEDGVTKWCVSWNAYAESQGEHAYTLILREREDLALEALMVGGVELHPYEYREEFSGESLTIWAKLVGSRTQVLRLRALLKTQDSFPVVRRGIQHQPRQMRFGVAEWSQHDSQIKARVVLVDEDANPTEHPELVRIEAQNTRSAGAFYMNFAERLAEMLEQKGILSAAEIEAARTAARDDLWQARHEFWRVPDVDLL